MNLEVPYPMGWRSESSASAYLFFTSWRQLARIEVEMEKMLKVDGRKII
jgi:hypothetical protein